MSTPYFPMFIDISQKQILVAGGGQIAARRVKTLLSFNACITVVAPQLCDEMAAIIETGAVKHRNRCWLDTDITDCHIILAATNDKTVNHRIWELCKANNILVNIADDQNKCDFFFPAVVKKEELVIGISSGGTNPGKVKALRETLDKLM